MVFIASDHAGYQLKEELKTKFDLTDLGTDNEESCDYPDIAHALAKKVVETHTKGILICGTGIGMSIAANKIKGARAALCYNVNTAQLARKHNDANILCIGSRTTEHDTAAKIVETFLRTDFEGGRHKRRVEKIED